MKKTVLKPLLALVAIVALVGGMAHPAVADTPILLDGAVLPGIVVAAEGTALVAATADGRGSTESVFAVTDGTASSRVVVDAGGLPTGASLIGVRLELRSVMTPQGGAVHATPAGGAPVWGTVEGQARTLDVGAEGATLDWTFTMPGDYELVIGAEARYALPDQPEATTTAADMTYRFHVVTAEELTDAAPDLGQESEGQEAATEPTIEEPDQPPAAASASVPAAHVLSEGMVDISNQWEDGNLRLRLIDESGTVLDPGEAVFSLPNVESWPGGGFTSTEQGWKNWNLLVPSHSDVWRTKTAVNSSAGNDLMLRADAHGVSAENGFELMMSVADAASPEGGAFTTFRGDDGYPGDRWHSGALGAISARTVLIPDAEDPVESEATGFAFTAAGTYCITLESEMLDLETGFIANTRATLTFAVGVDPATVAPCVQPTATEPYDPTPTPTTEQGVAVIDAGDVHLSPALADDGTLRMDLNQVVGGRTTTHAPEKTVFSVPRQDAAWPAENTDATNQKLWGQIAAPGTRLWRTAGNQNYSLFSDPGLPLTLLPQADTTPAEELVNGSFALRLVASDAPEGGYVASYVTQNDDRITSSSVVAQWDSRENGSAGSIAAEGVEDGYYPFADPFNIVGLAFTAPGRYCLTVESRGTFVGAEAPAIGSSTLTFAVGIDAASVEPCAQVDGGDGPTDPGDEDIYEDLDPTVTWFHQGHLDIGPMLVDGELELHTGDVHNPEAFPSVKDAVWVGRGKNIAFTVPEPSARSALDYAAIGPPGTPYFGFSMNPAFMTSTLWPGLTHEGLPAALTEGKPTWTLLGYTGPEGGTFAMPDRDVSSTTLPASFIGPTSHQHLEWAFTKEGVYCLNFEIRARDIATGADKVVRDQLTIAIGDSVDLHTMQPCSRTHPDGPVSTLTPIDLAGLSDEVLIPSAGDLVQFAPVLSAEGLDVATKVVTHPWATSWHDPESVVIAGFVDQGDGWRIPSLPGVEFTHSGMYLPRNDIQEDATIRVGEVDGPGTVSFDYYKNRSFGTRDGESRSVTLWPQFIFSSRPSFSAPGVYCVPLTWSATLTDGTVATAAKTITYVVGIEDPATVTPCAKGGEGTDPGGEGPEEPEPVDWDVPNGTKTDSGATILNVGHVDVASVLNGDAFDTRINDTTESNEPVWRDPANTVLQAKPAARTTVPDVPEYAFLGAAGAASWILPETQDDALLWPGWSTEAIADDATRDAFRWSLVDSSGPGEFALFQTGVFGEPNVLFNTRDGITAADTSTIPKHTHAHGTWAFSAEGVYCLAFERATTLSSGQPVTDAFTLAIAVGAVNVRKIDPAACFTAIPGQPTVDDLTPIPDGELTDATVGGVSILNGENGFVPGQLLTAQLDRDRVGSWVSVWLHSTPRWLGWAQVGESGAIQVRLPADAITGGHRLVVKTAGGDLLGWDSLSIVSAPTTPSAPGSSPGGGTPAAVQVPATQCVAGATILSSGHIDYASRIVGGQLESLIGDDTSGAKVYREPGGTILWLKPSSRVTLPSGYGQVGPARSHVWQVPQTQNPNLIWLGWSTEALNAGNTRGPVSWTIDSISGPGSVKVYLTGSFGGVQQVVFDNGGSYGIPLGVHAHANWAFSAEGIYRITSTQTATLVNGQVSSDTETLTIVVGDIDPASAAGSGSGCGTISNALLLSDDADAALLAADQAAAQAADAARKLIPGQSVNDAPGPLTDPFTALAAGNSVPLLLSILGALLLVGAAGTGVLWWRRRSGGLPA
ncbi:TIGR03773 family transporter-associated surface protein [Microbacterium sp. B2969]|uniref:TIGR03773 family transporter-associated surface protein n=1 Tax=Microbacterium alkaliflavum TaxID=3248839 RepID=A0ABW7QDM3_9MICO